MVSADLTSKVSAGQAHCRGEAEMREVRRCEEGRSRLELIMLHYIAVLYFSKTYGIMHTIVIMLNFFRYSTQTTWGL